MNRLLQAAQFASLKHSRQRRKNADASPYINHPLEVAHILANLGQVTDEDTLIAALLHDTVEDTDTSIEEVAREFGDNVAKIVSEVTDDKSLAKAERKQLQVEHAPHRCREAQQLKICDKISNLRSILADPPVSWSQERKLEYFHWAKRVVDGTRGCNRRLEAVFDQVYAEGVNALNVEG